MSDSIEKTEEKRQEFVSSVSHEIQSPLTSIQGFSRTLREEKLTADEQEHYLSIIEKESKRLSVLSKQLLTLSFLDSEIDHNEKVRFNLADQLKEVVFTTEWQWREKDIAIEMDITPVERSEEHTSELQSRGHLVCRLLLEEKKLKHETGE